ncbi:WD40 repeat domain-containing protein [Frankia sp. CNm7]|uniref:WD40 repeat domain-containing protein n=1 Tax=Frankia nepalensis TaxID=1836974 RepID=A0A937UNF6_9ACTN|nr:WD40 repeat domain-containing protein [Frankia nepalensis]MBL7495746.1 WD40 repeat domain-containing protein [Frankia nepalensis]MBL7509020.1 WD40 repeat domain-containing protein [Frankia nepalensis]MBL7523469.1 WD40 repeat domain-containing protein [Frankia nepalensis]MBL7629819.1 WD40 repeat domain-containing protein [Frankia nepalensis]
MRTRTAVRLLRRASKTGSPLDRMRARRAVSRLARALLAGDTLDGRAAEAASALVASLAARPTVVSTGIADTVRRALRSLPDGAASHRICALALGGDAEASAAAADAGYLPPDGPDLAALLVLTGQIDRYRDLVVDDQMLAVAYTAAAGGLKERLRAAVRESGQVDALRMMLGGTREARLRALSRPEQEYLVDALVAASRYEDTWALLIDLPVLSALFAAGRLHGAGWAPRQPGDRVLFDRLAAAQRAVLANPRGRFQNVFPEITGRVTHLSFAPDAPQLVLTTESGDVHLWDLDSGRPVRTVVLPGGRRGVDRVLHLGNDQLFIVAGAPDGPHHNGYLADRDGLRPLALSGWVRAVVRTSAGHLVVATTSPKWRWESLTIETWSGGSLVSSQRVAGWGEGDPVLSWDGSLVAFGGTVYTTVSEVELDMSGDGSVNSRVVTTEVSDGYWLKVIQVATGSVVQEWRSGWDYRLGHPVSFSPDGHDLVFSDLDAIPLPPGAGRWRRWDGPDSDRPVRVGAFAVAEGSDTVVFASGPDIVVSTWSDRELVGRVPGDRKIPRHLAVSPDGELFAALNHDDTVSLWDRHIARLGPLLAAPLTDAVPADLALVDAVSAAGLPERYRDTVEALAALLRHRFAHEIHLAGPAENPPTGMTRKHDVALGEDRE